MTEKLLNIEEVCEKLNISEELLRKLVDKGGIPAYRLGGTILRFKSSQIEQIRLGGIPQAASLEKDNLSAPLDSRREGFKDFLYFNDFYIISAIIIIVLLITIFFY